MHLRIRNVSKTYPNGVRAIEEMRGRIWRSVIEKSELAGHVGRRRARPEASVAP
jgi:hypothetical protein